MDVYAYCPTLIQGILRVPQNTLIGLLQKSRSSLLIVNFNLTSFSGRKVGGNSLKGNIFHSSNRKLFER